MTNEEIKKLKDAGIDDATIQGIIAEDAAKQGANVQAGAPATPVAPESLPEVDVNQPSDTLKNAQAMGVPTVNEGSLMADAVALGAAAAPYALPATGIGAGLYGAAKVGGWGREIGKGVQAMAEAQRASAAAQQATAQGLQQRFNQRMSQQAAQQAAQSVKPGMMPSGYATPTYNVPTGAPPATGPISPTSMPSASPIAQTATKAAPGLIDRTTQMVRQIAASKILPAAGNIARGSVGPGMALYSGELNTGEEEELRRRRMMQPTITR